MDAICNEELFKLPHVLTHTQIILLEREYSIKDALLVLLKGTFRLGGF